MRGGFIQTYRDEPVDVKKTSADLFRAVSLEQKLFLRGRICTVACRPVWRASPQPLSLSSTGLSAGPFDAPGDRRNKANEEKCAQLNLTI